MAYYSLDHILTEYHEYYFSGVFHDAANIKIGFDRIGESQFSQTPGKIQMNYKTQNIESASK